jgi:hypothetical protein
MVRRQDPRPAAAEIANETMLENVAADVDVDGAKNVVEH